MFSLQTFTRYVYDEHRIYTWRSSKLNNLEDRDARMSRKVPIKTGLCVVKKIKTVHDC